MKKPSSRKIDKTMKYILNHPNMSDDEFNNYASDPEVADALMILKSMKAIDFKRTSLGGSYLYNFHILDDGILYFYKKKLEHLGFWKGFITGIISTVVATIITNVIMWIISIL